MNKENKQKYTKPLGSQEIEKLRKTLKKPNDVIVYKLRCIRNNKHKRLCFNEKNLVCEECLGNLEVTHIKVVSASIFARKLKKAKEQEKVKKAIDIAKRRALKATSRK